MDRDDAERRRAMVARQIAARGVADPRVLEAMLAVPREPFVPPSLGAFAYDDTPLPIGEGQTISQPYIVALMLEAAALAPGDRVLEIGTGSGYVAALLGRLAGQVWTIERHAALASSAARRLAALGCGNVTVIAGDGSGGLAAQAPFDAILVAARSPEVPEPLRRQLTPGGRLVLPVGAAESQQLRRIVRTGPDSWSSEVLGEVRFVPLVGAHGLAGDDLGE